jgi:hypothetical protein
MQDGLEAGRSRGGSSRRQGAKVTGSGKRPEAKKLRVQYHLGEKLIERLGVHASLVHRNQSAVVEEILTGWLTRYGRGRELFPADPEDSEGSATDPA